MAKYLFIYHTTTEEISWDCAECLPNGNKRGLFISEILSSRLINNRPGYEALGKFKLRKNYTHCEKYYTCKQIIVGE